MRKKPADQPVDVLKLLTLDGQGGRALLAEFSVTSNAQLLPPWHPQNVASLIEEHHPDFVLFDYVPVEQQELVAQSLAEAGQTKFIPLISQEVDGPTAPPERRPIIVPGGMDPLNLRELLVKMAWEACEAKAKESANPLTGLPGNLAIKAEVERRLAAGEPFVFLYLDYDHFKVFNDAYGFSHGDQAIQLLAQIVRETVAEIGNPDDFVGHIGGDDFAIVTTPDRARDIAGCVIEQTDAEVPQLYSEQDRQQRYVMVSRRRGKIKCPLMTVSIAAVSNIARPIASFLQLSEIAAELKAHAKSQPGSVYLEDRRRGDGEQIMSEDEFRETPTIGEPLVQRARTAAGQVPVWGWVVMALLLATLVFSVTAFVYAHRAATRKLPTVSISGSVGPGPVAPTPTAKILFTFEGDESAAWAAQFTPGATAEKVVSTVFVKEGKQSLQLNYALRSPQDSASLYAQLAPEQRDWTGYKTLGCWLFFGGSNAAVRFELNDSKGTWSSTVGGLKPGWQEVRLPLGRFVMPKNVQGRALDLRDVRYLKVLAAPLRDGTQGMVCVDSIQLLP